MAEKKFKTNFEQTAKTLAEALPYLQRYEDAVVVIKLGGHAMTSKTLLDSFARDIVLIKHCGVNPIIVHGGGPMINSFLSDLKNISYEKFSDSTTQNFFNLFGKLS